MPSLSSSFGLSFGLKLLATAMVMTLGVTSTSATDFFVPNGDFECGLTPWTVVVPDSAITYFIGTPGRTSANSFQVRYTPPGGRTQSGVSARIISPPVTVVPNVPYQLTFWTNFDNAQAGSIGVMLNDQPYYTVGATDRGWGGDAFAINTVNYTPANDTVTIKFEYYFEFVASLDRIDQISFSRVV